MPSQEAEADTKETGANFYKQFTGEVSSLLQQIDDLFVPAASGANRSSAVDQCLAGISKLASDVKDASPYLPGYDQRMYTESLKSLSARLDTARASIAPKPKFSFKSRKPVLAPASDRFHTSIGTVASQVSVTDETSKDDSLLPEHYEDLNGTTRAICEQSSTRNSGESARTLSNVKNGFISWSISSSRSARDNATSSPTTATLSHIDHCVVNLCQPPSPLLNSLTLHHITSSLIIAPPQILGPIHITRVSNSVILIPLARQYRMHHCENVSVYLNVGSRPVVEGVKDVSFAPAPRGLVSGEEGFAKGSEGEERRDQQNFWDQVDDFNWLRKEQSPHWKLVPVDERIGEDVWRRIVGVDAGKRQDSALESVDDVLRAVGLS